MKKSIFQKESIFILTIFIFWQLLLLVIGGLANNFFSLQKTFLYSELTLKNPKILWKRANFDGVHYLSISRYGYGLHQEAFFPFYPTLIKKITPFFGGKDLVAALFISNFSFLIALWLFYQLMKLDYEKKVGFQSLAFFLLFPTSFFFGMVYAESLFLLLVLASFYAARRRNWWLAGIFGGLAAYTRLIGIFLLPSLIYEYFEQHQNRFSLKRYWRNLVPLIFIPLGLLIYMKQLWETRGDPLLFIHVQPYFGAERSGGKIILLYQVFWRYFKMALTTKLNPLYFTVWLEILTAVGFLVLLVLAFKRKVRLSYLIFAFLAFLTPTLSGTFSSLPRYVLVLFPCFILLGNIKKKSVYYILGLLFGLLFLVCTAFFYQGYWIS